jgi:hypothetical protein
MKSKPVTRYECDYCGKRGYSASHMAKHEKHCTLNPNRQCRVCQHVDMPLEKSITEVLALLPKSDGFKLPPESLGYLDIPLFDDLTDYESWGNACYEIVQEYTDCPACTLAILRQAGTHPSCTEFDYKAQMKELWQAVNEEQDYSGSSY